MGEQTTADERRERLAAEIRQRHAVSVGTEWESCDWPMSGLLLSATDAAAGTVLAAELRDDEMAGMSDAEIFEWVAAAIAENGARKSESRKRREAVRRVDAEN